MGAVLFQSISVVTDQSSFHAVPQYLVDPREQYTEYKLKEKKK